MKIGVVILLIFITAGNFIYSVLPSCNFNREGCYNNDQAILDHSAGAPYRYRVLSPYVMSLVTTPANETGWFIASLVMHVASFGIIYAALYQWLRRWTTENAATAGLFLMALLLAFAFHQYPLTPSSILEVALLCLALVVWKRFWLMIVLVVLASLNRETGVLLVAAYALLCADDYRQRSFYVRLLTLGGLWAAITAILHLTLGTAPHVLGLQGTFQDNLNNLPQALFVNVLLLPLWIVAAQGYRRAPVMLKRFAWLAAGYLFSAVVGGLWEEMARLSLPAVPLLLPLMFADKTVKGDS